MRLNVFMRPSACGSNGCQNKRGWLSSCLCSPFPPASALMMHVFARRDDSQATSYLQLTCVIFFFFFLFCFVLLSPLLEKVLFFQLFKNEVKFSQQKKPPEHFSSSFVEDSFLSTFLQVQSSEVDSCHCSFICVITSLLYQKNTLRHYKNPKERRICNY